MEDEVPNEVQAAMSLKLMDSVKTLVRQHIREALEDPSFMGSINSFYISDAAMRHMHPNNINFQQAVKQVMVAQMQKQ